VEPICQSHRSLEKITSVIAIKVIQKLIRPKKKKKIRDIATQCEKSQKWLITKLGQANLKSYVSIKRRQSAEVGQPCKGTF